MTLLPFAKHLRGVMLPGLFSSIPDFKRPRFPDDPWAAMPHSPTWYWMHTSECRTVSRHSPWGSRRYEPHWREVLQPGPAQGDLF